jgi:O-antigen ligase
MVRLGRSWTLFNPVISKSHDKISNLLNGFRRFVGLALLFSCAFFATWGDGLQQIASFDIAKLFAVCASALILYWLILEKPRFDVFPRALNYFMMFAVLHTLITYGVFYPSEFTFNYEVIRKTKDGFILAASSRGLIVGKYFLFAGFAYAAAAMLSSQRVILTFSLCYSVGLMVSFILGSHVATSVGFVTRSTGGFMNSNSLGLAALVAIFLCLFVIRSLEARLWQRGCAFVLLVGAVYALLRSVSRTSIIAGAIGILIMIVIESVRRNVRILCILFATLFALAATIPEEVTEIFLERFAWDYVQMSEYGQRLPIYLDYLRQWPQYIINGMGHARAGEAIGLSYMASELYIPHGAYLSILVEFGIAGLCLFLWSMYCLWKRLNPLSLQQSRAPTDSVLAGFLVAWAVFFITGNYGGRDFWLAWAVLGAYGSWRSATTLRVMPQCPITCQRDGAA